MISDAKMSRWFTRVAWTIAFMCPFYAAIMVAISLSPYASPLVILPIFVLFFLLDSISLASSVLTAERSYIAWKICDGHESVLPYPITLTARGAESN